VNEEALAQLGLSRQKETKDKTGVLGVTTRVLVNGFQRSINHAAWSVGVYGHDLTTEAAHSLIHITSTRYTFSVIFMFLKKK
jgi:hypothetical protein